MQTHHIGDRRGTNRNRHGVRAAHGVCCVHNSSVSERKSNWRRRKPSCHVLTKLLLVGAAFQQATGCPRRQVCPGVLAQLDRRPGSSPRERAAFGQPVLACRPRTPNGISRGNSAQTPLHNSRCHPQNGGHWARLTKALALPWLPGSTLPRVVQRCNNAHQQLTSRDSLRC